MGPLYIKNIFDNNKDQSGSSSSNEMHKTSRKRDIEVDMRLLPGGWLYRRWRALRDETPAKLT